MITVDALNERGAGFLPGHLNIVFDHIDGNELRASLEIRKALMAPNGFLHAGTVVTLADTSCGYGCIAKLPEGATGFTTIELKSNFLGGPPAKARSTASPDPRTSANRRRSGMPSSRTVKPARRSRCSAARR